jgi:hypothetical protein
MLFLIPVGGGIPAGVLLAREHALPWPLTAFLYFVSDVILAFLFEPLLRLLVALGRKVPLLAKISEAMKKSMDKTAALYGAGGAGPITLILIAFGIDPMTGRAAALAAGHGFISGWAIAIAGDMMYFGVIMAATLKLSAALGDPNRAMAVVLVAMLVIPLLARRVKVYFRPADAR